MKAVTKSALFLTAISGISSVMLGLTALAAESSHMKYINMQELRASSDINQEYETTADVLTFNNTYNYTYCVDRVNGKTGSITGSRGYTGNYKNCSVMLTNKSGQTRSGYSSDSDANNTTVSATSAIPSGTVKKGEYVFIVYEGTESFADYLTRAYVEVSLK